MISLARAQPPFLRFIPALLLFHVHNSFGQFLSQPSTAAVAGSGQDEVTLKNGGLLRGTVVESDPERRLVTIVIQGTGEQRTLNWSEVAHVDLAKSRSDHG